MRAFILSVFLALACLCGSASATGIVQRTVFVNNAGQNVVFVRNQPFVETVVVNRGLFGFRRQVIVRRSFGGAVFINQVTPFGTVVRVRVR